MFSKKKDIESVQQLFLEFKCYFELQKKYLIFASTEKLARLLSTISIAVICLILLALVLLYLTFATAYYLGDLMNSLPLGFLSVSTCLLLILLLFYKNRKPWVIQPIARFIADLFLENYEDNETE